MSLLLLFLVQLTACSAQVSECVVGNLPELGHFNEGYLLSCLSNNITPTVAI